ncbi:MAG TPA: protein kinase [Gemmataceae bacterium]|nr:protein kinase [Gemmataceae bacterium]
MPAEPLAGNQTPTTGLTWLEEIIGRFENAWRHGQSPAIENYLPDDQARRTRALVELVYIDLELRLKAGEAVRVESYLERYPQLTETPDLVVVLVQAEYALRQRTEPTLTFAEYFERFPQYQDQLQQLIAKNSTVPPGAEPDSVKISPGFRKTGDLQPPARLGRYEITATLGSGGFGVVYKGHDAELRRDVAIKVPHASRITKLEDAEAYLAEARVVASLDHPHIVPVHDMGRTEDGLPFVVSKFIEGGDLAKKLRQSRFSFSESAQLVATVAEALQYAHQKRLVHRDLKPANILLDGHNKPYLTDFGLALKEEDFGKQAGIAGTPAYMSPEQANGEAHLVDGRSDIFSLGVIFYELLTGRRPFIANDNLDLLVRITAVDARPPRQLDVAIPKELERICLKALAKRASERYTTAFDLADDLHHWLSQGATIAAPEPVLTPSAPIKIVPKGLRSFDANDAYFFLELLPGPRGRDGLPDSIHFWKSRIEETDPDNTFRVGLIYGPSGCGKSSLVKAGLLPYLSDDVIAVYIEASADETEARLLKALRKLGSGLSPDLCLAESLAALRRGQGIPPGKKVLIVLDQFEQWLHTKRTAENPELVQALRQCDGGRLQCVVMVRDDFWLAVSRFMKAIEVEILEGRNSALVDLFDPRHAKKVLAAFGRAFGTLPERAGDLPKDEEAFLDQAVAGLAQDGKIISVRLALFAEMVKGRQWTPAMLKEMGGMEGVGVTFLEETFAASTAPPQHRLHQKAAQAALKALLPESGTDIKGTMRSQQELLEASGYAVQPKNFENLLRILDGELRLITPTDPEGKEEGSASLLKAGEKYFQLTHDYLVHSLREWLTRKQKETRRGRAELLLADRAAVWNARPENRQLPSLQQWLQIKWFTAKKNWTSPQQKMMRKAGKYHAVRGMLVGVLLAVATFTGLGIREQFEERRKATYSAGLVGQLLKAETAQVPGIITEIGRYRAWADPLLQEKNNTGAEDSRQKLHASLALLPVDSGQFDYLYDRLLTADPEELRVIRDALKERHNSQLMERLRKVVAASKENPDRRLRAACALAGCEIVPEDAGDGCWQAASPVIVKQLLTAVQKNPSHYPLLLELLRPAKSRLLTSLGEVYRGKNKSETERGFATAILADYAADQPQVLADLVMDADAKQFSVIYPKVKETGEGGAKLLLAEVAKQLKPTWSDTPLNPSWQEPDAEMRGRIEAANGMLHERFAFCQNMPLAEFIKRAEELRASGYRPTRFRPYADAKGIQVAAVWTRDGQEWQMAHGLSADEIRQRDVEARKQTFHPMDVSAYQSDGKETYAILWVKVAANTPPAQLVVGLNEKNLGSKADALRKDGYRQATYSQMVSPDGMTRICAIWRKVPGQNAPPYRIFSGIESDYRNENRLGGLQVDVQVSKAGPIPSTKERYTEQLQEAEKLLQGKPNDAAARLQRALAYFNLEDNQKALADLSLVIKQLPQEVSGYQYRAIVQARLGKGKEARDDLAKFTVLSADPSTKAYADALVAAYLGDEDQGMKRLEAAVTANAKQAGFLYDAACAYSLATEAVAKKKDQTRARSYADRAVALLKQAIAQGYSDYMHMETDSDLDPIRQHIGYSALLKGVALDRRYTAVWRESALSASVEVHGLDPVEHLARSKSLIAQGYRPVSLSVADLGGGVSVTASVWHRPVVADNDKETLAKRQANAAVALLRMNQPGKVWPLLKHSPDPRVRSYVIHRLSPLGVDAKAIIRRVNEEPDISIRRALILSLGEYGEEDFALEDRKAMLEKLQEIYRTEADPGLHASAEWLLRTWKQEAWLKQTNDEWAKDKEQREKRLEGIQQLVTKDKEKAPPQWYVNGQGQTMVVVGGPVEFMTGSPPSEVGRGSNETQHKRRIGRTFALASTPVTKEQFLRFQPKFSHIEMRRYPEPTCPIGGVLWYEAAAYCNWLSKEEGIAEDQWCYEIEGNKINLRANYLSLRGYRLPTEAEMEYATRAGALTSRYFGETEELLAKYAWYSKNSQERTWRVGSLKPNDLGLFDSQGNVFTWCQEAYKAYPAGKGDEGAEDEGAEDEEGGLVVKSTDSRVLRGGSFAVQASYVRSAYRDAVVPANRSSNFGFRPARTLLLGSFTALRPTAAGGRK